SGFLLGYIAVLPLIGRIADLRGRLPVLVGSLVVFALGSLVTAASYDLASMVVGRFLQGVGGGGLVPATLALVADLYPVRQRGIPLGVVGAVQELGSVLGPLYGAMILALANWRWIFVVNVAVAVVLGVALRRLIARESVTCVDGWGVALLVSGLVGLVLTMAQPASLTTRLTIGLAFVPLVGESRWLGPVGVVTVVLGAGFVVRCLLARHPLVDLRRWRVLVGRADLVGAGLLALCLGAIIVAFATADPEHAVFSPAGPWLLVAAALLAGLLLRHLRRAVNPIFPRDAFAARPAWGALVVSLFVGAALVSGLVDIPIFARVSVYPNSQLDAALVLVRLLVALPAGALLGGRLTQRFPAGPVAGVGMILCVVGYSWMAHWGLDSLRHPVATVPLVLTGFGFGLALAPVNAALLAATADAVHGVSSALLVVARMVGMLVGISALTELGLRRYYAASAALPTPTRVCHARTQCSAYTRLLKEAGLTQLQTVFVGAAVCALLAGVVALLTLRTGRLPE
ncbi:MAG: MFS transporter, partial [Nocardioidaceae bacterium]